MRTFHVAPPPSVLGFKVQGNDLYTAATIQKLLFILSSYISIHYFIVFNQEDVGFLKLVLWVFTVLKPTNIYCHNTVRCTRTVVTYMVCNIYSQFPTLLL